MADHPFDPDDTASFSIPSAVRAPVGTTLPDRAADLVRSSVILLYLGLAFLVIDLGAFGEVTFDAFPDVVGGLLVLVGVRRLAPLAAVTGPEPALGRATVLALLQLPLLLAFDIAAVQSGEDATFDRRTLDVAQVVQTVVALLGTAITGTLLARAHDAMDQLRRRDRWMRARRTCLALSVVWLPVALPVVLVADPSGVLGAVLGFLSVLVTILSLVALWQIGRALGGSLNVRLPDR